jgi:uncharacterized protein (DUF4415 family)
MKRESTKKVETGSAAVGGSTDRDFDTSDIPELTEEDFAGSVRLNGRTVAEVLQLYRVRKAPITARIDLDVLEWLKGKGDGYQTRLNSILRAAMVNEHRQHPQK